VEIDIKEISEKIILIKNQQLSFINTAELLLSKDNREDFIPRIKKNDCAQ